jgi:hypothetical protein
VPKIPARDNSSSRPLWIPAIARFAATIAGVTVSSEVLEAARIPTAQFRPFPATSSATRDFPRAIAQTLLPTREHIDRAKRSPRVQPFLETFSFALPFYSRQNAAISRRHFMLFRNVNPYGRAALWATTIVVGALVVVWVPHIIWPPRETPNALAHILSAPGIMALLPGILITGFVRILAYMIVHHAEISRATASGGNNVGISVVVGDAGFSLSYSFICSLLVTWGFYFLIAWQIFKARAQRLSSGVAQPFRN